MLPTVHEIVNDSKVNNLWQRRRTPSRSPERHRFTPRLDFPLDGRFPSVDAPFQARENVGIVAARGRMLSSVRPLDAAGRQPPACMGVRGPGPDHPKRARSTVESPGCPSPVSPLLRHTLLPLALTSWRSWSAYAATAGVL